MKTYYLCDLVNKTVISGGALPEVFGNINCLEGLTDEHLADLGWAGSIGFGFLPYSEAVAAEMDMASLEKAHKLVLDLRWLDIQEERDRRKDGGFPVDNFWFHSDESSRSRYLTYLGKALEENIPTDMVIRAGWKTMSGELIDMTVGLIKQIRDSGINIENGLFDSAVNHRAAMAASEDPLSYDFSQGWPLTYLEASLI
jgi:hypothetical protein